MPGATPQQRPTVELPERSNDVLTIADRNRFRHRQVMCAQGLAKNIFVLAESDHCDRRKQDPTRKLVADLGYGKSILITAGYDEVNGPCRQHRPARGKEFGRRRDWRQMPAPIGLGFGQYERIAMTPDDLDGGAAALEAAHQIARPTGPGAGHEHRCRCRPRVTPIGSGYGCHHDVAGRNCRTRSSTAAALTTPYPQFGSKPMPPPRWSADPTSRLLIWSAVSSWFNYSIKTITPVTCVAA